MKVTRWTEGLAHGVDIHEPTRAVARHVTDYKLLRFNGRLYEIEAREHFMDGRIRLRLKEAHEDSVEIEQKPFAWAMVEPPTRIISPQSVRSERAPDVLRPQRILEL